MNNPITPIQPPYTETRCCDPQAANVWLQCVTEWALDGNRDALRELPQVVDHFIAAHRQIGVPR